MSPISRFFNKTGKSIGNFFKKDVARPVAGLFRKGGVAEQSLRGISTGLGQVGRFASGLAKNPLVTGAISGIAPELLPLLPLAGDLAKQGSSATDIRNYKGQNPAQIERNLLERYKTAKGTVDDSGIKFY